MRDESFAVIHDPKSNGSPLYFALKVPVLDAAIQRVNIEVLGNGDLSCDLSKMSGVFGDFFSLFLSLETYLSTRVKISALEISKIGSDLSKMQTALQKLPIRSDLTKDEVLTKFDEGQKKSRKKTNSTMNDDSDYSHDEEEPSDVLQARECLSAMRVAVAKANGRGDGKEETLKNMEKFLNLNGAGLLGQNLAVIDIICGGLNHIDMKSVLALMSVSDEAKVTEYAAEHGVKGNLGDNTVAWYYAEVISSRLQSGDQSQEAADVFVTVMAYARNMVEPFVRGGSVDAATGRPTVKVSTGLNSEKIKAHCIATTAVLLHKAIEHALQKHIGMKINFLPLLLRLSYTTITKECNFVLPHRGGMCIFDEMLTDENIVTLCTKMTTMLKGACAGRGAKSVGEEFKNRGILLECNEKSVGVYERSLMIPSAEQILEN